MGIFGGLSKLGKSGTSTGASLIGVAQIAASHPIQTTAAVLGIGAIASYGSSRTQSIAPPGASVQPRPSASEGSSDFDLGASGDLVFALHRNR